MKAPPEFSKVFNVGCQAVKVEIMIGHVFLFVLDIDGQTVAQITPKRARKIAASLITAAELLEQAK